ncbi:MAG TPA: toast rack family protein [Verrucomicrobiae bacterium]|nr:toast rack family protein [Verrucomicrobiae bacterium]
MAYGYRYQRSSLGFALLLITVGGLWLYANMHPGFDPWGLLRQYWPVILIAIGVGKLVDFLIDSHNSNKAAAAAAGTPGAVTTTPVARRSHTGEILALIALVLLVIVAMSHRGVRLQWKATSRSVDAQGAETAKVSVTIPAGDLTLRGGAGQGKILDANFHYTSEDGEPVVNYTVSGKDGTLDLSQDTGDRITFGTNHNDWSLRLSDNIPTSLQIKIGAGHGDLDLHGLTLSGLDLEMGAGQVNADLAANWKKDSAVTIQGGVGQATLRLPDSIGVSVHASGGIGAISSEGLHKQGDDYVNDAYGKSPVTLDVNVEGGVGQINLVAEH